MSLQTQAQRFIDTLNELGGSAGNGRLSSALGWADDTYERVKAQLIEARQIVPGRGRAGARGRWPKAQRDDSGPTAMRL